MTQSQPDVEDGQRQKKQTPKTKKTKPSVFQRLRRRDYILLLGLLSLACLSVIVVGLLVLRFQTASARLAEQTPDTTKVVSQPTYTVPYTQVTGLSQYLLAESEALAWAGDAQLISAHANWVNVLAIEQVGEPGNWIYQFYSPGKQRLFIATVEPSGQTHGFEHIVPITLAPPGLETGSWVIDSPTALAIWLDNGGAGLVRSNPGLEILIQLRYLNEHPAPVWLVAGTDRRTQDTLIVVSDTVDGTVLSISPKP